MVSKNSFNKDFTFFLKGLGWGGAASYSQVHLHWHPHLPQHHRHQHHLPHQHRHQRYPHPPAHEVTFRSPVSLDNGYRPTTGSTHHHDWQTSTSSTLQCHPPSTKCGTSGTWQDSSTQNTCNSGTPSLPKKCGTPMCDGETVQWQHPPLRRQCSL